MTRIIFTRAYMFNRHQRYVGNITTVEDRIAEYLIEKGVAKQYTGDYPPKNKTKINLKDLK
jgi:hypothetical protein